jgi:hypothetical protein
MTDSHRQRLASWKEIAAHLHREVRTVIRWEKERGLPVHRVPGGQGGSVFAFTDELDAWSAGQQETRRRSEPAAATVRNRALRWAIAGLAVLLISVTTAMVIARSYRPIATVSLRDTSIAALDRDGAELWTRQFPQRVTHTLRRQSQIIDLNRDGHADVLAGLALADADGSLRGGLFAIDSGGRTLWERSVDGHLSFGAGDFTAPWLPDDVFGFTNGGEAFAALAVHHQTWWPSMLAVFNAQGTKVGTFVQSGWIRLVRATADGRHLVTGGFSNSRGGAAFAVLDARHPDGASPEDPGSAYECRTCPDGRPLRYFVLDWSDVTAALPPDERDVAVVTAANGSIELRAVQRTGVEMIVELSPQFDIVRRSVSDAFWEWHKRLERDGVLKHSKDTCPYRQGPVVREWSPAGWRTLDAGAR